MNGGLPQEAHLTARELHYGWVILVSSFVITSVAYGATYSFGLFFKPLQREFGWSATEASVIYSLYIFSYCLFGIASGWAVDRFGPRVTTVCGGLLVGSGLLLSNRVHDLWHIYVTYGLLAGAGMSTFYTPLLTTASRWFPLRQGMALGIVTSGIGVGTFLGPLVLGHLVSSYGWRTAYLIGGSAIGVIAISLGLLLRREPTKTSGGAQGGRSPTASGAEQGDPAFLSMIASGKFWVFSVVYFLVGFGLQMMIAHVVPYIQEIYGFSPSAAGAVLSTVGVASFAGRLIMGSASDYIGTRRGLAISVVLEGAAVICILLSPHPWLLFGFSALFGFGYGGHAPQFPALIRELFGLRQLGRNIGIQQIFYGLGAFLGPFLAGCLKDATGGYRLAFALSALSFFSGAYISLSLRTSPTEARPKA